MPRGQSGPLGPRKARPTKTADVIDAPKARPAKQDSSEAVRLKLEELGLDPVAKLVELINGGKVGENMQIRALEILTSLVVPKQKPRDEELEALKRQTQESARFVILGEREDESAEAWEARNKGRVPIAPLVVDETVPEGVVPS